MFRVISHARDQTIGYFFGRVVEVGGVPAVGLQHHEGKAEIGGVPHYWQESGLCAGKIFGRRGVLQERRNIALNHSAARSGIGGSVICKRIIEIEDLVAGADFDRALFGVVLEISRAALCQGL